VFSPSIHLPIVCEIRPAARIPTTPLISVGYDVSRFAILAAEKFDEENQDEMKLRAGL